MKIALIDTRTGKPGESLGTLVGTYATVEQAFSANNAFQKRCGPPHVITKIVSIQQDVIVGEMVMPAHLKRQKREKI